MERMEEKLRQMEGRKRWNSRANEKQFTHNVEIKQILVEDVRSRLEDHFGTKDDIPGPVSETISLGEKKLEERIKMLRMADKVSWLAVDKYVTDPLCKDAEDDRRWKAAIKEAKEEQVKSRNGRSGYYNRNRREYKSGKSYGGRENKDRYVEEYSGVGQDSDDAGRRRAPVIAVADKATFREIVEPQRKMESSVPGSVPDGNVSGEGFMDDDDSVEINITENERVEFNKAAEKLDSLEGKIMEEDSDEVCLMFEEDVHVESKVHDTLRKHLSFWEESGASDFAV